MVDGPAGGGRPIQSSPPMRQSFYPKGLELDVPALKAPTFHVPTV
jgi:hypothetical protein